MEKDIKMDNAQELKRIRLLFQASRKQFGEVFIGKSASMVQYYETGRTPVPESVMMIARVWEDFYKKMHNK